MGLTDHFTMTELTASIVAERKGINNTAPDSLMPHLFILAVGLEQIRKLRCRRGGHRRSLAVTPCRRVERG